MAHFWLFCDKINPMGSAKKVYTYQNTQKVARHINKKIVQLFYSTDRRHVSQISEKNLVQAYYETKMQWVSKKSAN